MRLLDRYLLRELLTPLFFCVSGILVLCLVFDIFANYDTFLELKLSVREMLIWQLISLPTYFVLVFPITLLLALLYALTTHARHHEITAIRAAGVSLWRLGAPYFAVGLLGSLLVFALNELWIPDTETRTEVIAQRHLTTGAAATNQLVRDFGFTCAPTGAPRTWLVGVYDPDSGEMPAFISGQMQRPWLSR